MSPGPIPILDLEHLDSPSHRDQFAQDIGHAFSKIGFAAIRNHTIPKDLIESVYVLSHQFFALPLEEKISCMKPESAGERGYLRVGAETHVRGDVPDNKEAFSIGRDPYHLNVWPPIDYFADFALHLYEEFENTSQKLLSGCARYLDLPHDYFYELCQGSDALLRLLHYPPVEGRQTEENYRCAAHTDSNLITLLWGATKPGLCVKPKGGAWMNITMPPDVLVINVGDMLERLTNNHFQSTLHKVQYPTEEYRKESRFSMPFFYHPRKDAMIKPLESCISDENPLHFPPYGVPASVLLDSVLVTTSLMSEADYIQKHGEQWQGELEIARQKVERT